MEDDEGYDKQTALNYAILNRNKYLTKRLVEAGCDVNCTDGKPIMALIVGIGAGSDFNDCIKLMIKHGGKLNKCKQAYFNAACEMGNIEIMRVLKEFGVDLNKGTSLSFRPLQEACNPYGKASVEVVKLLPEWGASVNADDGVGETPLDYSMEDLNKTLVLLDYSPNLKNILRRNSFKEMLGSSSIDHQVQMTRLLLAAGAQITEHEMNFFGTDYDTVELLKAHLNGTIKLKNLCRQKIRSCLKSKICEKIKLLSIPTYLKEFLMFSDII